MNHRFNDKPQKSKLTNKYNIVADENMPCIDRLFGSFANIQTLSGREITADNLKNADALLCRSITKVDQSLLQGSKVQFVGTATIGIDHLDTQWLEKNDVGWSSAAGCNAAAVAQYVISGICYWLKTSNKSKLQDLTVGIVGAGNVGSELARCLDILKVKYLLCDPPLKRAADKRHLVTLDEIAKCDVISFHVPITHSGDDKTFHLIDNVFLNKLTSKQLLINAARGEVADNRALLNHLKLPNSVSVILDVFENEPTINCELARSCLLATPHIAGHTLEGKLRGSYLIYQAFCQFFKLPVNIKAADLYPQNNVVDVSILTDDQLLLALYDIQKDTNQFLSVEDNEIPLHFDRLRKDYVKQSNRRDYSGWTLQGAVASGLEELVS